MITFTERLNKALCVAATAHEKVGEHRKGGDIPYIIHPVGVMIIASAVTSDEDILIACLLHDVLEDVPSTIYDEGTMRTDFGDRVLAIVRDVTKDPNATDWYQQSHEYLNHLRVASNEAIIVSASDKIHNLQDTITDYHRIHDDVWQRFATKSAHDQLWWYQSVLAIVTERYAPAVLVSQFSKLVHQLEDDLVDLRDTPTTPPLVKP